MEGKNMAIAIVIWDNLYHEYHKYYSISSRLIINETIFSLGSGAKNATSTRRLDM